MSIAVFEFRGDRERLDPKLQEQLNFQALVAKALPGQMGEIERSEVARPSGRRFRSAGFRVPRGFPIPEHRLLEAVDAAAHDAR
jgi:hypothetical protein